jgi:SAM-dependent methyltransferase
LSVALARVKAALPARHKQTARGALLRVAAVTNAGAGVTCPCCGRSFRRFARFHGVRDQCPGCGSLMRHRAIMLYLRDRLGVEVPCSDVLVVAPGALQSWLEQVSSARLLTVDLESPRADVRADITDLPFEADAFDLIVCLHVLEHVPDDRRAIREFFRVLRPGGCAVIQVPPDPVEATVEDPTVTSPAERERRFDQYDHVRLCGPDYGERIEAAGFAVEAVDPVESLPADTRRRFGVRTGEPFYLSRKRAS